MEIKEIVETAFEKSKQKIVKASNDQERNRQRSINWVESLTNESCKEIKPVTICDRVMKHKYNGRFDQSCLQSC